jgi:hypothetical protein
VVVLGTRSEIYIRCRIRDNVNVPNAVIELYKHWGGYPEFMVKHITQFARWARRMVKDQLHWLLYPEDVAALLITYDFMYLKKLYKRLYGNEFSTRAHIKPDIIPRGFINDLIEYVYILDVCENEYDGKNIIIRDGVTWKLKAFEVKSRMGISDNVRKAIREGTEENNNELELKETKIIKIKGKQSPILVF